MIRHIVMFRSDIEIESVIAELEQFCNNFEGIIRFQAGNNIAVEPHIMHGFSHCFTVDFQNQEARDRYLEDQDHKKIGQKLLFHCKNGVKDVIVFDMEL